jgi:cytidyltransferase-like protein
MRVLGIVAEYNPFHNGHLYQLQKAKSICSPDATIVVMSGNFTQRGEPAIVDKWTRARIALLNGADLVFELPFVCATSSADFFAMGAVSILCGTGVLTHISFGSEDPDVGKIRRMAAVLSEEPEGFKAVLKKELDEIGRAHV